MNRPPMWLVEIPCGEFWMGSSVIEVEHAVEYWRGRLVDDAFDEVQLKRWLSKEVPKHRRSVRALRIGVFPVTNRQYAEYIDRAVVKVSIPSSIVAGEPLDHPVWGVSWCGARAYCEWLSEEVGTAFRLPSEAEWEYVARGPSGREYPFGDEFDSRFCNTVEAAVGGTTPVDRYALGASEWGVYDLGGNVEEWTSDLYSPYPGGEWIADDISQSVGWSYPVLRGGSFARGGDLARCARRHGPHAGAAYRYTGFRVCCDGRNGGGSPPWGL